MAPAKVADGAPSPPALAVRRLTAPTNADIRGLTEVLLDCVAGGASVSFMSPLSEEKALAFWQSVATAVELGQRALLIAEDATGIVGTVQLILDQPENQPHRADLAKMLVHRRARRRGAGEAVLRAAEELARELGKTLLVLDTASSDAERLYLRRGWIKVGVVPGYALWPTGGRCDTAFFYRLLDEIP
jgi:GNAT superfamily N-acetyltransferase